jgi:type III restriction enzyme
MTPPGQANETVTVIEHPAFTSLYLQELQQQGVMPVVTDAEKAAEPTTVSIFPDEQRKDVARLDIHLPALTARFTMTSTVDGITLDDVRHEFSRYEPLPLGAATSRPIDYEGRHLITDEVVERFKIDLPLLGTGVGAVSYFVRQVETVCKVRGLHQVLAPLIQSFLEELLFAEQTSLFDERLVARLGDSDVAEHVRAVFVPLVRARATVEGDRKILAEPRPLSLWRPFQVTQSERRPAVQASRTLFNLVPCNNASLEVAMAGFLDRAGDVAAFAKNAGPQALRIDFLASGGRLAFYTPDFFARAKDGRCYLIETKGRVDLDVPRKARAAIAWCEAATAAGMPWRYIYVPQGAFERLHQDTLQALLNTCETSLQDLIRPEEETAAKYPLFATLEPGDEQPPDITSLLAVELLDQLPPLARAAAGDAAELFRFIEGKEGMSFAPVFQPLLGRLDDAARALLVARLSPSLPAATPDQRTWFEPYYPPALHPGARSHLEGVARNLKKTLVFNSGVSLIGLLRSCMDYALNPPTRLGGVFEAVEKAFRVQGGRDLLYLVTEVNDFRNTYIAHEGQPLVDAALAETNLRKWVDALARLHTAAAAQ